MKQSHQCPHCKTSIEVDMPDGDPYGTNKFFKLVHCDLCSELKAKLIRTNNFIDELSSQIRTATDPAVIDKISGSLKAHYTGRQRIQEKLDALLPTSRQTEQQKKLAKDGQSPLPW